jgi:hypothetical protein
VRLEFFSLWAHLSFLKKKKKKTKMNYLKIIMAYLSIVNKKKTFVLQIVAFILA